MATYLVYPKVSLSGYFLAADLCICSHVLLQEEASLVMTERGTHL